jgi:hypothetical protein
MEQQKNEEIDLIYILSKFKKTLKGFILLLFDAIDYVLKKWIIITILIVIGLGIGYFTQDNYKPNKKATALVRINFDLVAYVYTEIDLINDKIKERDSVFFSSMGLKGGSIPLKELDISPIVNLNDILGRYEVNDRKLEGLLRTIEFEDDDIKLHETFNSEYYFHTLDLTLSNNANQETLNKTIEYINSNKVLEELKESVIRDTKSQIENNLTSIKQINDVINTYKTNESISSPSGQFFVVDKNFSINSLFEIKFDFQEKNEKLKKFLVYAKDIVVVVNKPKMREDRSSWKANRMLYYPMLYVFIFLFFSLCRHSYYFLRKISNSTIK